MENFTFTYILYTSFLSSVLAGLKNSGMGYTWSAEKGKRKISCPFQESNPDPSAVQPTTSLQYKVSYPGSYNYKTKIHWGYSVTKFKHLKRCHCVKTNIRIDIKPQTAIPMLRRNMMSSVQKSTSHTILTQFSCPVYCFQIRGLDGISYSPVAV
jgi:hypothetical protein